MNSMNKCAECKHLRKVSFGFVPNVHFNPPTIKVCDAGWTDLDVDVPQYCKSFDKVVGASPLPAQRNPRREAREHDGDYSLVEQQENEDFAQDGYEGESI